MAETVHEGKPRPQSPLARAARWAEGALALVGGLAILLGIATLFTDLQEPEAGSWSLYSPRSDTQDLLLALSGAVNAPVRRGGSAEILVNGDAFLPPLLADIANAEHTVHFMTYVWKPGRMSDLVFAALVERARSGIAVRLMLDDHGAEGIAEDVERLREAGGRVHRFNPIDSFDGLGDHRRNHRRAIVIDGQVGYTGGASVADEWLGDAEDPDHWRDDLVRVTGPMARSLQAAFAQLWSAATGEIVTGPDAYGDDGSAAEPGRDTLPLHVSVVSSPSGVDRPLAKAWWLSFAGARERIWITTPYFVPDGAIRDVLADRAREGLDVRVLTAGEHVDIPLVRWAARYFYEPLLEAGVRIYEYQPTLIHSKQIVVDGVWSLVGSANLDVRSAELNQENLLAILDPGFAATLEHTFEADLARSREIELEAWRERGAWQRVLETGSSLLREQL